MIIWDEETMSTGIPVIDAQHKKLFKANKNEIVSIRDSSTWLLRGNNKPRAEANFTYIQDRNVFWSTPDAICQHCNKNKKTIDHLATKCERMLGHDYTRRHNEVVRCIHLNIMNKYGFKRSKKLRTHSVQEVMENQNAEVRVDTRIKTDVLIKNNRPDIFIYDKKANEVIIIEIGITCQDLLQQVENEKKRKYDLLANELGMQYKAKSRIIPYVMTWDGVVTKFHRRYLKELSITPKIEAYIQSIVLKKTLESISLDKRRSIEEGHTRGDRVELAVERLCNATLLFENSIL
jgi:hypothetical protein